MNPSAFRSGDRWDDALRDAISRLPERGALHQIFLEEREDLRIVGDSTGAVEVLSTRTRGAAARGPLGQGREVYLSDPSEAELVRFPQAAGGEVVRHPRNLDGGGGTEPGFVLERENRIQMVRAILGAAIASARGLGTVEARVRYVGFRQDVRIAGGAGISAETRMGGRFHLRVDLVQGSERTSSTGEWVYRDGYEVEPEIQVAPIVRRAAERAGARALQGTTAPVVFAPGVGGIFIHELVGHALEADTVLGGGSYLARLDGAFAPPGFTVLDDPRRCRVPWRIDDEGQEARVARLVQGGRVVGKLCDLRTAASSGCTTTGHGRRSSFQEAVRPRMGCTFLTAGAETPESVIGSVAKGIYVRRMEAAQADIRTGSAIFKITDGDRIESGRLAHPIQPMFMSVRATSALASVHAVADDLAFDTCLGSCLRDGQPMVTSVGAPTFCVGVARLFR